MLFVPNRWDVIEPFYNAWGLVLEGRDAEEALNNALPAIEENLDKEWEDYEEDCVGPPASA